MKKLKLFFALFAMLALGVGNAWAEEVTFDATSDKGSTSTGAVSFEKDGITLSAENGALGNGTDYRIYKNTKLTISSSVGSITNIAFTFKSASYDGGGWSASYQPNAAEWTSPAANGEQARVTKIVVTYTPSTGGGETPDPTPDPEDPETPETGGDATMAAGSNGSACTVNGKDGIKVGTSSKGGDMNITVPAGATMLHVYAAAWNNVSGLSLNITPNDKVTTTSIALKANTGIANSTPFTLSGNEVDYLFDIPLQNITTETTLTFTSSIAKRFVVWGATYETASGDAPEPVIVKTLKSIAVSDMTTIYEQGDLFKFDGTCTATYSVTKDGVAQDDETAEVTPTSVSVPDMNQIGTQTITVTYETVSTTYGITITENEVTAGTYNVLLNNELWNVTVGQQAASVESMTGKANDITFYTTKGSSQMYASATQTRFYNGATFVISVPNGYVIKSIVFTEPTSEKKWDGSISASVGTYDDGTKSWSGNAQEVIFSFAAQNRIANASITFEAVDLTLPSAPTFNPEAGTYNAVQNVTISAEAGTTIYYTLDGIDPTTESNVYSTPIEIAETKTLKAIAVKDEKVSPVASATYTINLPLITMDQIFAKATAVGSTATSVEITFGNWVVSAVKEDGKTAFVTDGTKGFVIYEAGCGFKVGDVLSGTAACKVLLYNGFAELTGLTSSTTGLSVTTGGTITTQELDAAGIAALTGVNTGSLIKINGTCTSESSKYYVADVQIYTSLYDFGTLEVGAEYNITGIYQPYNATKEMLPRSAADIEKVVGLPTATISIADITMEIGQEKTIEATITPDAAQSTVQYAITAGSEFITLNGTTITAIAAGTATITATIAEKADEYKGATKEFIVTVKPQNIAELPFEFTGGKADIENTLGMSQEGLGSDYTTAGVTTKLKFDGTGDWVVIHFNGQAEKLAYEIKGNGFSGGEFTVQQSADGSAYTDVVIYTELDDAATKEHELAAESHYVKFIYTTKSSGNVGLGNIKITEPDNRANAELAWSEETVTLTVGDAFTAPTFSNPNSLSLTDITFASDNEAVATVNAGVISLVSGKTGTATITATYAGNETYKPAEVKCTISVNPQNIAVLPFAFDGKCADIATTAGMSQEGIDVDDYASSPHLKINTTGDYLTIHFDSEPGALSYTIKANVNSGDFTGGFDVQVSENGDDYDVLVSYTELEKTAAQKTHKLDKNVRYVKFVYTNKVSGQNVALGNILISKLSVLRADLYDGKWGTFCPDQKVTYMQGASFYTLTYLEMKDGMPYKLFFDEITTDYLEAGKPYLFIAEGEEIKGVKSGEVVSIASNYNGFYGNVSGNTISLTTTQTEYVADGDVVNNYGVINSRFTLLGDGTNVAHERAHVQIKNGQLDCPNPPASLPALAPGARRVVAGATGINTATGVDQVQGDNVPTKMIINGQLFILRGEKMYDAQGKLVK